MTEATTDVALGGRLQRPPRQSCMCTSTKDEEDTGLLLPLTYVGLFNIDTPLIGKVARNFFPIEVLGTTVILIFFLMEEQKSRKKCGPLELGPY